MTVITTTFVPCGAKLPIIGLIAKENVVAAFGILFGFAEVAENGEEIWSVLAASMTGAAAYSFLVFNLLCAPCFAALGVRMQYRYAFTSLGCCFLQGSLVWARSRQPCLRQCLPGFCFARQNKAVRCIRGR